MKILMLAPEPYFQPRGTPISVYFRLKVLSDLGHKVDLITYHLGEDRSFKNVKILRILNLFCIIKIKIGPSLTKLPLDFLMLLKAVARLVTKRYDLVFSHEEAAFFGVVLAKIFRVPHVYDMHSSLPQQLENFSFSRSIILKQMFVMMERFILKNSQAIIVICPDLLNIVKAEGCGKKAVLLENFLDFEYPEYSRADVYKKRRKFAGDDQKIVLYAGNFLPYQGIPLFLKAAAKVQDKRVVFLLVGDTPEAVEQMQREAVKLGISDKVFFTGQVGPALIPLFISLSDVLVSPRISGTNTPLKIYSFLKSGKPVVATNLWTHSQVLNDKIAILVDPDVDSMAVGIRSALFDKESLAIARAAKSLADSKYILPKYMEKIELVLAKTKHRD